MPLPWFRRKQDTPAAPSQLAEAPAAAPEIPVVIETEPVAPTPEAEGAETEAQKRKRRRGSRGERPDGYDGTASPDHRAQSIVIDRPDQRRRTARMRLAIS